VEIKEQQHLTFPKNSYDKKKKKKKKKQQQQKHGTCCYGNSIEAAA
jgi:hypothetical protein